MTNAFNPVSLRTTIAIIEFSVNQVNQMDDGQELFQDFHRFRVSTTDTESKLWLTMVSNKKIEVTHYRCTLC